MKEGYVYVLFNSLHPDLVKVGKTTKTVEERVAQINSTGVPMPFVVAHKRRVKDCDYAEKCIHNMLDSRGKRFNKEFFKISLSEAIQLIESIITLRELETENDVLISKEDSLKNGYMINSQKVENFYGRYKVDSYVKALPDTRVKQYHILYDIDPDINMCPLNFEERAFKCLAVNIAVNKDWDIYYSDPYRRRYYLLDSSLFPKSEVACLKDSSIWGRLKTWLGISALEGGNEKY